MGKDKTIQDLKVDAHIAVLHTKVDSLIDKQKELTERVRANEKVVAAVTLLGTVVIAVIGAGYFAPKAEAAWSAGEMIQRMRDWKSEQTRQPIEIMLDDAMVEYDDDVMDHDCEEHTEEEEKEGEKGLTK